MGSLTLNESQFYDSLNKVLLKTRDDFNEFKESVAVCKAVFKSKHLDSKEKFYALIVSSS